MIHQGSLVHPTAIIHDTAIIYPGVTIGAYTLVEAYSVIGSPPEHREFWGKPCPGVEIGKECMIREFTTINAGTTRLTQVGDRVVMLRGSHLGHDARVEDDVTISCNVLVGGKTIVMKGANLGLGSIVHQNHIVGPYAMLGAGCVVPRSREIEPFNIYVGNPARFLKVNDVGLNRAGVTDLMMHDLLDSYESMKMKVVSVK